LNRAAHEDRPLVWNQSVFIPSTRLNHKIEKTVTSCSATLALFRNGQKNDHLEPIVFLYNVCMAETLLRTKLFVPPLRLHRHR
jgi:hypothetical protein